MSRDTLSYAVATSNDFKVTNVGGFYDALKQYNHHIVLNQDRDTGKVNIDLTVAGEWPRLNEQNGDFAELDPTFRELLQFYLEDGQTVLLEDVWIDGQVIEDLMFHAVTKTGSAKSLTYNDIIRQLCGGKLPTNN